MAEVSCERNMATECGCPELLRRWQACIEVAGVHRDARLRGVNLGGKGHEVLPTATNGDFFSGTISIDTMSRLKNTRYCMLCQDQESIEFTPTGRRQVVRALLHHYMHLFILHMLPFGARYSNTSMKKMQWASPSAAQRFYR